MNVLVTGASRGIGRAISAVLADEGYNLLLVARNGERLRASTQDIKERGKGAIYYLACDLADLQEIERLYRYSRSVDFKPDVLVLNAGIFIEGALTSKPTDAFDETLRMNFLSAVHTVRVFIDDLRNSSDKRRIILISSTAAHEPYPIGALYGVAKWALRGYAINLREELKHERIGVTLISPGGTLTDLWAGEELPPRRLLEPSDIALLVRAVLSLSEQAVVEDLIVRPMLGDIHS
jgi:short-subunit dehydrogenase